MSYPHAPCLPAQALPRGKASFTGVPGSVNVLSMPGYLVAGEVASFIRAHALAAPGLIRLSVLARQHGYCVRNLQRHFRQRFGMAVHAYMTQVRQEQFRTLLRNTRLSIKEIAHLAGYSELANFSRDFRRREGISASEYRRQQHCEAATTFISGV